MLARGGITASIHRNYIREPNVRPYTGAIGDAFILMQDNALARTVRVSITFVDDEAINLMNWPARSPKLNLNLTEHTLYNFLDAFDNGHIIQRMCRTLSMPWFMNCRPYHKMASWVFRVAVRSTG